MHSDLPLADPRSSTHAQSPDIKACTTAVAMSRTRMAGTSSATPQQVQETASVHVTVFLDLPGTLLAQIWKQLEVADRKCLCCTAPGFRKCAEINVLLTDCKVELGSDGNPTPETQLQHWPRHAPPPKRLRISFPRTHPPPGNSYGLLLFLRSCMQQGQTARLLRGVQELWLEVSGAHGLWRLSDEDAPGAASMLGSLCPSVATLHLPEPVSAAARSLCTWQALRSFQLVSLHQADVAALAQLTQLQALYLKGGHAVPMPIDVGCLSALTGLHSLSLSFMQLARLPLVAQACSSLTQLKLKFLGLQPLPPPHLPRPPQPPCIWPSLVELHLHAVQAGATSHVLPTPHAAPQLARLPSHRTVWPQGWPQDLPTVGFWLISETAEGQMVEFEQLAADVRCLAACPVPCQALRLSITNPVLLWAQLAAALAPLGPTITHLQILCYSDHPESQAAFCLPQALPQLQRVRVLCSHPWPEMSHFVLHCPSLTLLDVDTERTEPSSAWLHDILLGCGFARSSRPQGALRVRLPMMGAAEQQKAREMWGQLAAQVAGPVSVVVTDREGKDLLSN